MLTIERNVPLPSGREVRAKYPLHQMEVGDSFVAPDDRVRQAAYQFGRRHSWRFASRKQPDGTYRCWRVA